MFTSTPFVPLARIEVIQHPSIVIDLVMVTVPNPPGSRASISPPMKVLEIAPAKVLQGAVRLHGLASSPTPDTHVRVACACAIDAAAIVKHTTKNIRLTMSSLFILFLLRGDSE